MSEIARIRQQIEETTMVLLDIQTKTIVRVQPEFCIPRTNGANEPVEPCE